VLVGAFFEGETIVVLGGFAAHRGDLVLPGVIAGAFAGSLAGDQFAYFLGR
jgi:membrane protein DedA with SNARE-associated domain